MTSTRCWMLEEQFQKAVGTPPKSLWFVRVYHKPGPARWNDLICLVGPTYFPGFGGRCFNQQARSSRRGFLQLTFRGKRKMSWGGPGEARADKPKRAQFPGISRPLILKEKNRLYPYSTGPLFFACQGPALEAGLLQCLWEGQIFPHSRSEAPATQIYSQC